MKTEEWLVLGGLAVAAYLFWQRSQNGVAAKPVVVATPVSALGSTLSQLGAYGGTAVTLATGLSEDVSSLLNNSYQGS